MEDNKIIIKNKTKDKEEIFALVVSVVLVLLLGFQVIASRHIKKATQEFIESERAKNTVVDEGTQKRARAEKFIEQDRLRKQKEAEERLSLEKQSAPKELSRIEKVEQQMDYRKKLEIARNTGQNPK